MKTIVRTLFLTALFVMIVSGAVWAQQLEISIVVNGVELKSTVAAQNIGGRVMVPLRFVSQALGAEVGWDPATSTAIVRRNPAEVGINTPLHNATGTDLKLEIEGVLKSNVTLERSNGSVLVPLRVVSEAFGALVDWNDATQRVTIDLISFKIDGRFVTPELPARLVGGRTVVPLRFVSQALGAQVGWDAKSSTAIVRKGFRPDLDASVPATTISDNALKAEANGVVIKDESITMIDNRVLVPMRLISQMLNARVDWDDATKTVSIQSPPTPELYIEDAVQRLNGLSHTVSGNGSMGGQFEKDGMLYGINVQRSLSGGHVAPDLDYVRMTEKMGGTEVRYELYSNEETYYVREGDGLWRQGELNNFAIYAYQTQPNFYLSLVKEVKNPLWYTQERNEGGKLYTVVNGSFVEGEISIHFKLRVDPESGLIGEVLSEIHQVEMIEGIRVPLTTNLRLGFSAPFDYRPYMPIITPDQIAPDTTEQTP